MKPFTIRKSVDPQVIKDNGSKDTSMLKISLTKKVTVKPQETTEYIQKASNDGVQINEVTKEALAVLEKDQSLLNG